MNTYSVEQYAAIVCGADDHGQPLPGKVQWLVLRLRRGELPGYKAGRKWRATQADVDAAIEKLRPRPVSVPTVPAMTGLTRTSARRLAS
jgi:hypothetical protein